MELFTFLCDHLDKHYTPRKWAELLGIQIIDADGWSGTPQLMEVPTTLYDFITRVKISTICPRQ